MLQSKMTPGWSSKGKSLSGRRDGRAGVTREGSSFQGGTVGSYLTGSRWLVWHHPFYSDAQVSG